MKNNKKTKIYENVMILAVKYLVDNVHSKIISEF